MSSYFEQHLLFCVVWSLGVVAHKCRNTKNKNLKLTSFSLPRNRKIGLCEEHFEESCSSKPVDLGRRWTVKIKSCLISFFIYNKEWRRFPCSFVFCVTFWVSYLFYSKRPTTKVNWYIHLNHFYPQGTKRRARKETPAQVLSC